MNDRIFAIAHYADQGVLYLLVTLCFLSLLMIINRYFILSSLFKKCIQIKTLIEKSLNSSTSESGDVIDGGDNSNKSAKKLNLVDTYLSIGQRHTSKYGLEGLDHLTEGFKNIHKSKLEKYLNFLATVGSNAPYIGLFGTVLGIMKSFSDMSAQSQSGNSSVMSGISAALIATAAGLLAAIPAVLAYNYFQKQVKFIFETIDLLQTYLIMNFKKEHHGRTK